MRPCLRAPVCAYELAQILMSASWCKTCAHKRHTAAMPLGRMSVHANQDLWVMARSVMVSSRHPVILLKAMCTNGMYV